MKALIFNNKVADVCDAEFEVAPDLFWVVCDSSVEVGDSFIDGTFISGRMSEEERLAEVSRVQAKKVSQQSANQKLLDLGLTQEEATALTGYTPSVEYQSSVS